MNGSYWKQGAYPCELFQLNAITELRLNAVKAQCLIRVIARGGHGKVPRSLFVTSPNHVNLDVAEMQETGFEPATL